MDFGLSTTQQLLVGIAREFLDKHGPLAATGAPRGGDDTLWRADGAAGSATAAAGTTVTTAEDERDRSDALWREMAQLGWFGLLIPQTLGGSGGSLVDVVLLLEEIGRAGVSSPFVESGVAATAVLLEAADPRHERLLAAMAVGERVVTLARNGNDRAAAADGLRLSRRDRGRLDGRAVFVRDADIAHALIVAARGDEGCSLVVIPVDRPGLTLVPMPTMSGERRFDVRFRDVGVQDHDQLGQPGRGGDALAAGLRAGAIARAAEVVGAAQRILDLTVEHAKVRVQSDRPIGAFQAIQHTCADLLRNVDGARWIVRQAAWKVAHGNADADAAAAMAKAWSGEACLAVARRAHQVLGAIGYCDEHPLHRLHKTILAGTVDFGDTAEQLETVARAIGLAGGGMSTS